MKLAPGQVIKLGGKDQKTPRTLRTRRGYMYIGNLPGNVFGGGKGGIQRYVKRGGATYRMGKPVEERYM